MQIFLNEKEIDNSKETDSLLELLREIQENVEKKEETITRIIIDDIENNLDLNDEDSDISLDYIDKIDVFTEHIDSVSLNVIDSFGDYFKNVLNQLPTIAESITGEDKISGVDSIYQLVDGIKQLNVAIHSMSQMKKLDVGILNESKQSLNDVLVSVNDVIIDLIEKLNEKQWELSKDLIEFDLALKISELVDFFPKITEHLKGDK